MRLEIRNCSRLRPLLEDPSDFLSADDHGGFASFSVSHCAQLDRPLKQQGIKGVSAQAPRRFREPGFLLPPAEAQPHPSYPRRTGSLKRIPCLDPLEFTLDFGRKEFPHTLWLRKLDDD